MIRAVDQENAKSLNRSARQLAVEHRLLDPLVDRRAKALRDDAADDLVLELVALVAGARLDDDLAVAELAAAARLLLVAGPRPPVIDVSACAYVRISAIGTSALMLVIPPCGSMPWRRPRRELRSPFTAPTDSSGVVTSSSMIGSRSTGSAFSYADLNAIEPAILNAISEESTVWYEPSTSETRTP